MRTTAEGIALVKKYETCRLVAFWDALGRRWTIAWGRTQGVQEGDTCTQDQADAWFLADMGTMEGIVLGCLGAALVNDNQLSALVSFTYNVGFGQRGYKDGFQVLKSGERSTMLKCLLAQDYAGAAAEFPFWDHADGVTVPGLLARRKDEQSLFLAGDPGNGTI